MTAYRRDHETAKKAGGVRLNAEHWASVTVHAFWRWTGENIMLTWCGIEANVDDDARLTTDTITCLACPMASMKAFKEMGR